MDHKTTTCSIGRRVCAAIASGTLALSGVLGPVAAFADTPTAGVGEQTGTGATEVTVQMLNDAGELGGTEDENNPDKDNPPDGLGDNIAFTVPAQINFVAKANGGLIGPSESVTFLENESVFAIHASSMRVEEDEDSAWNIVADAGEASEENAIDFQVGPEADMLNAADYLNKALIDKPEEWNMESRKTGEGVTSDRVQMKTSGDVANVSEDITGRTKVGTLHWYVTRGEASA